MNETTKIKFSLLLIIDAISAFTLLTFVHLYLAVLTGPAIGGYFGLRHIRKKHDTPISFRFIAELGIYIAVATLILFVAFNVLFGLSAGGTLSENVTFLSVVLQQVKTNWPFALIMSCGILVGMCLQQVFVQANK